MKTATGTRENVKVIEEFTSGGLKVEVLEYEKLLGLSNASMAQQIYFMEQQHIHVRQIALYLNNEKVTIERGAMSYFQGNIEMVSGVTLPWKISPWCRYRRTDGTAGILGNRTFSIRAFF